MNPDNLPSGERAIIDPNGEYLNREIAIDKSIPFLEMIANNSGASFEENKKKIELIKSMREEMIIVLNAFQTSAGYVAIEAFMADEFKDNPTPEELRNIQRHTFTTNLNVFFEDGMKLNQS